MTCPRDGNWHHEDKQVEYAGHNKTYEMEYANDKKGLYYCLYEIDTVQTTYYFYVQGKGK